MAAPCSAVPSTPAPESWKHTLPVVSGCHDQLDGSLRSGLWRRDLAASPGEMSDAGGGGQEAEEGGQGKVGRGKDGDNVSPMRGPGEDTQCPEQTAHTEIQERRSIIPDTDVALTACKIREVLGIQKDTTPILMFKARACVHTHTQGERKGKGQYNARWQMPQAK